MSLSACDYSKLMNMGNNSGNLQTFNMPAEEQAQLSYQYVYQMVLFPKCTSCHGNAGYVNLEDYASTVANMAKIKNAVFVKGSMPSGGTLSQDQKAILWNWIKRGGPEHGDPSAAPLPPPEPLQPTFASIDENIFQRKCVRCHSATGHASKVPLDRASLLTPGNKTVIPGNPDESELVVAVERTDKKRMPPAKAGYEPLSDEEKTVIREWIKNGAQD